MQTNCMRILAHDAESRERKQSLMMGLLTYTTSAMFFFFGLAIDRSIRTCKVSRGGREVGKEQTSLSTVAALGSGLLTPF